MEILDPRKYLPGGVRDFRQPGILATFPRAEQAQAAARALREAGYPDVQVDEVSLRPSDEGSLRQQPWPVTLTEAGDRDRGVAGSLDPSISGNALGGEELLGGHRYMLAVAIDQDRYDKALEVIRKHGGNVDEGGPR